MGSLRWAQGSGLPSASVTSLWRWATSQLGLDQTTRYFQVDEEMLGLTDRDELNRTYMEDSPFPLINTSTERRPAGSNVSRVARTSTHNTATRDITHRTPSPKETRTTVTFTGTRNTTRTSVLPNSSTNGEDKPWTTDKHTCKTRTFQIYSEEKPSFNQYHTNKRRPYRLAKLSGNGTLNQDHIDLDHTHVESIKPALEDRSHAEPPCSLEVGDNGEESSYICAQLDEDGPKMGLVRSTTTGTVGLEPARTITTWEAAWNVTNAIQGIFVLGLPYALVRSGYLGLILLVLSAWVCNHTGRVLVDCLYEQQHSSRLVRVRHSYQDIAEACCRGLWPRWVGLGGWMVNVSQVLELMMTCTLYLVVSTSLVCESLSWTTVPRSVFSLGSLVALLPCLMLTDLRPVSTLSLLCSVAHGLISLLVMLYCLSRASSWSWARLSLSGDPEDILVSVGVIIFSYTSQIYLPHLEGSMEHRGEFSSMLGWSHAVACVVKTLFSLVAVLTWGAETREVITDNLPSDLRPLVNLCLLAKALLSYPLPFYSAAEILQSCLLRGTDAASPSSGVRGWGGANLGLLVRSALLMTSYLLALLVPRFSLLMGLTGSVTGAAMALILPCVCHLQLHWKRLSMMDRLTDVAILSLGLTCSLSGVICCLKRLMENV